MKKLYILLTIIFITTTTLSQSCLPEGITFTTQTQIDSFQINYPGCIEIEGDITINSVYSGDVIENLNGLNVITTIGNNFTIKLNYLLVSLNGLENLTSIEGYLRITFNSILTNLTALSNITSVVGLTITMFRSQA